MREKPRRKGCGKDEKRREKMRRREREGKK